jgi:hypothetical protein
MSRRGITVDLEEAQRQASFESFEEEEEEPALPTVQSRTRRHPSLITRSNTKEFKGLVAMINYSSKNKGAVGGAGGGGQSTTDGVLKRWKAMSRI